MRRVVKVEDPIIRRHRIARAVRQLHVSSRFQVRINYPSSLS